MADTLTFSLVPTDDAVTLSALLKGVEDVRAFIQTVDYAVTRGHPRDWLVERIHTSAPTFTLRPSQGNTSIIDTIVEGIVAITSETDAAEPPQYFTEDVLEHLKGMRRLFNSGIRRVEFSANGNDAPAQVSRDIGQRVDRIVGAGYSALGSIEGELGAIRTHGRPVLTIWELLGNQPVRCYFPLSRLDDVKNLLQRRVRVRGTINYFRNGRPRNITEFQGINEVVPYKTIHKAKFGSIPNITNGLDTVEYLRMVRG